MKAFVIKNKEGKYFVNRYVQAKKIYNAFIFEDKNDAEQVKGKDDEVVEITIAEGDLERKIAVLERALKNTCWLLYGTYDEHYPNYFIEKAKKELKGEKDE